MSESDKLEVKVVQRRQALNEYRMRIGDIEEGRTNPMISRTWLTEDEIDLL